MPLRIAFDTNLLVAALTKPTGASGRILRTWRAGEIEVVASDATLREAELVLGAGWLSRITAPTAVEELLTDLRILAIHVDPKDRVTDLPLKDQGDLRMLEAALEGNAQYIVTTDREFLSHRGYQTIEFVTPTEFWSVFKSAGDAV